MASRTRKISLHVAAESSFGTVPSGTDFKFVPVLGEIGQLQDLTQYLETNYQTGRNRPTPATLAGDGATFSFKTPLIGLASACGDGTNASSVTDDWLDVLLECAFGTATDSAGEGAASGTQIDTLVLDTAAYSAQHLAPVWESGVASSATQWRRLGTPSTASYGLHRDFDEAPTAAAIAYGTKSWQQSDAGGGASVALYFQLDGTPYRLLGCRVVPTSIEVTANQRIVVEWAARCDSKTQTSIASVPSIDGEQVSPTPLKGQLNSFEFNGVAYPVKSLKLEFGAQVQDIESIAGTNGRSDILAVATMPKISVEPLYATAFETAFRAGTTGKTMVRFGVGTVSGGVLNSCCFYAEAAQIEAYPEVIDDANTLRSRVTLKIVDGGEFASTVDTRFWTLARA